jgi:hypothetical protein
MRRRPRGFETAGDMLRSLGVVLAAVAVILLITHRPHHAAITVVDATQARQAAHAVAAFAAQEPSGLNADWRLTSARFKPAAVSSTGTDLWHLGWVTPHDDYAALEQSDGAVAPLVRSVVGDAARRTGDGTGRWAGWQVWSGTPSDWRVYVRPVGTSTLVVYGSASDEELGTLVSHLQPGLS